MIPAAAGVAVSSSDTGAANFRGPIIASVGSAQACSDSVQAHWKLHQPHRRCPLVRRRKFTVLLDANHGAGSILARRMLEELGCRVKILGGDPNGRFDHPPEPTEENLADVLAGGHSNESGQSVSARTLTPIGWR